MCRKGVWLCNIGRCVEKNESRTIMKIPWHLCSANSARERKEMEDRKYCVTFLLGKT